MEQKVATERPIGSNCYSVECPAGCVEKVSDFAQRKPREAKRLERRMMSLGIYPGFEPGLHDAKFDALGEVLARSFPTLDKIADAYGLTRFTAFADNREVPDDFDGPPDELEELLGPWNEWFDPEKGRVAFRVLAKLIGSTPEVAKNLEDSEHVVEELEELVRVLEIAHKEGAKFQLEMS